MALHLKQNEARSELQERIAAELQEKARKRALETTDRPDGVDDARYIENTKQTTTLAWAWLLIAIATTGIVIWLVIISVGNY